jgi:hypothetical protein
MSHTALKQLLHRNAPHYAMSAVGLGRVKTLGREERIERLSFSSPNALASNSKMARKSRRR